MITKIKTKNKDKISYYILSMLYSILVVPANICISKQLYIFHSSVCVCGKIVNKIENINNNWQKYAPTPIFTETNMWVKEMLQFSWNNFYTFAWEFFQVRVCVCVCHFLCKSMWDLINGIFYWLLVMTSFQLILHIFSSRAIGFSYTDFFYVYVLAIYTKPKGLFELIKSWTF